VKSALLLNGVVRQRTSVLELFPFKDQAPGNTLFETSNVIILSGAAKNKFMIRHLRRSYAGHHTHFYRIAIARAITQRQCRNIDMISDSRTHNYRPGLAQKKSLVLVFSPFSQVDVDMRITYSRLIQRSEPNETFDVMQ
jgi:hypothetical protein